MLPSEIPKLPTDPPVRGSPGVWKLLRLPPPPHLGMGHRPYLFCLSFYLLYFVLPPFKDSWRPSCLSGCLVSSASLQKLFCGICSAFKWSFDEFVGEKVVSPSYSSTILGLPPCISFRKEKKKSYYSQVSFSKTIYKTAFYIIKINGSFKISQILDQPFNSFIEQIFIKHKLYTSIVIDTENPAVNTKVSSLMKFIFQQTDRNQ